MKIYYVCYLSSTRFKLKDLGFFPLYNELFPIKSGSSKRNMYSMYTCWHLKYVEIIRPVKEILRISNMADVGTEMIDLGSLG